jgi:hypothetical protein
LHLESPFCAFQNVRQREAEAHLEALPTFFPLPAASAPLPAEEVPEDFERIGKIEALRSTGTAG